MSNAVYPKARQGFGSGDIDWDSDSFRALACSGYAYSAAHQFLSDIAASKRVATSDILANCTEVDGNFDADDVLFHLVDGLVIDSVVIYQDTGLASTSRLVCFIDSMASGLPFTPTGYDIRLKWSAQDSKIFRL